MTARTFDDVAGSKWGSPYVSHSFQTLVTIHGSDLVLVDHGDAFPRTIRMNVIHGYPQQCKPVATDLMTFNGEVGDNTTGASATGLVSGPSGVVVVGNSVRHDPGAAFNPKENRNVFTIAAGPKSGSHHRRWLTSYAANGPDVVGHPRVVTLAPDRFAVLFTVEKSRRPAWSTASSTRLVRSSHSATSPASPCLPGRSPSPTVDASCGSGATLTPPMKRTLTCSPSISTTR